MLVAELELDVEIRVEVVVWLDVLAELLEDEDEEDVRLLVMEVARSRAAEEVVLVVLALEDRLEVATRVLEDVLEVKLSVSPRSAMVSELSIVLAPAPTSRGIKDKGCLSTDRD